MMRSTVIPVAEWLPDAPYAGGLTASNVIPWKNSYKSFGTLTALTTALTDRCQGGYFSRDSSANVYNYAGDEHKLYALDSAGTYNDVSRVAGGAYSTAIDDWWEFTTWGQTVIATNFADVPQVITMGAANFAALAGSPPKARHLAIIKDFLVMGNVTYGGTAYPNQVYWSALNNPLDWTIASATQCDIQTIEGDGGWVQKIVGGEYGLVFLERQVWRMTYIGSPVIFQFDLIEKGRGAFCPQGVVGWGNMTFFIAEDGFFCIEGGGAAQPIGDGKVDNYFLSTMKSTYNYRVSAGIDPVHKIVYWAWPTAGSTTGLCNSILAYNWTQKRWSSITVDTECFARYASVGYTLDSLDTFSTNLDTLPASLDSRTWTAGTQSLSCFDSSHKLGGFTGTAMSATVDTQEKQLIPGMRAFVSEARPLVDGNAASVAMKTRERLADSITTATAVAQNATGNCPQRSSGFYHSARITTAGAFDFIEGVEVVHTSDGRR
jgi:hypothetical protein